MIVIKHTIKLRVKTFTSVCGREAEVKNSRHISGDNVLEQIRVLNSYVISNTKLTWLLFFVPNSETANHIQYV